MLFITSLKVYIDVHVAYKVRELLEVILPIPGLPPSYLRASYLYPNLYKVNLYILQ